MESEKLIKRSEKKPEIRIVKVAKKQSGIAILFFLSITLTIDAEHIKTGLKEYRSL